MCEGDLVGNNGRRLIRRICETCGKEFGALPGNVKKGMGRYCCAVCARRGRGDQPPVKCQCQTCGKEFWEMASRVANGKGKFCSKSCYSESLVEPLCPRACDHCGTVVQVLPYRMARKSFMCSKACRNAHSKDGQYVTCENPDCGKTIYRAQWRIEGRKHFFCSVKCRSAVIHGENHHLWEGGFDPHDKRRGHEFTHHERRLILERDNYTCCHCGDEDADILEVDHILAIGLGGSRGIDNGQTLCERCHDAKSASDRAAMRTRKRAA